MFILVRLIRICTLFTFPIHQNILNQFLPDDQRWAELLKERIRR